MTDQHPITPPPGLVQQWANESPMECSAESWAYEMFIAHRAARWGADQELEACCEWVGQWRSMAGMVGSSHPEVGLRTARRPKPPSLKEQALRAADLLFNHAEIGECALAQATVRRALEALPE
jgi:hypothetical protein